MPIEIDVVRSDNTVELTVQKGAAAITDNPNPLGNVIVTGVPEDGDVLTATSPTTAEWDAPTGGVAGESSYGGAGPDDFDKLAKFSGDGSLTTSILHIGSEASPLIPAQLIFEQNDWDFPIILQGPQAPFSPGEEVIIEVPHSSGKIVLDTDPGFVANGEDIAALESGKEPTITATTTADYWRGDKSFQPVSGLPVSTAAQTALNLKANLASPAFTGTPTAPNQNPGDASTKLATTAFVSDCIANVVAGAPGNLNTLDELSAAIGDDPAFFSTVTTALSDKAPLASPTFTGTVTTPAMKITGGVPGIGKVWTSDADGDGSWETPTAGVTDHTLLSNIGTNTHAQLDTHLGSTSNPHSVTATQVGLGSVENTALSTWAGTTSITTLGTIGTGVWQGTAVGDTYIASAATWNAKQSAISFGTGVQTSLGVNVGSAGAPVLFNGALGTPSSGTLTNASGLPAAGVVGTAATLGANTFTGANIISTAGAASTPALKVSGVPFAGTGTTSFPLLYIADANATASSTLSTAGTYLGVNGDGTQNLCDFLKDGTTMFKVTSTGVVTCGSTFTAGSTITASAGSVECTVGSFMCRGTLANVGYFVNNGGSIRFTADGVLNFRNDSNNGMTRVNFGMATSSFPALKVSSTTLQHRLADDSADAPVSCSTVQTVAGTLASLGAAGTKGRRGFINDGSTTLILGLGLTAAGSGSNNVPVYDDGTNWIVG